MTTGEVAVQAGDGEDGQAAGVETTETTERQRVRPGEDASLTGSGGAGVQDWGVRTGGHSINTRASRGNVVLIITRLYIMLDC